MTLDALVTACHGTIVTAPADVPDITAAYASDMLSDVMAHALDNSVLITIQNHNNTIAVCTLTGVTVVLICHAREIPLDMKATAERESVAIVTTPLSQFEACCALHALNV